MRHYKILIGLMLFWMVLGGTLEPRLILSGVVASILSLLIYLWLLKQARMETFKTISLLQLLSYMVLVFVEIIISGFSHALRIVFGNADTEVSVINLGHLSETALLLIAGAVTLTPGTLTLEISPEQLHVLHYKGNETELNRTRRYVARLEKLLR